MYDYNKKVIKSTKALKRKTISNAKLSSVQSRFLEDRLYQYNLYVEEDDEEMDEEQRKLKKLSRMKLDKEIFKSGLEFLGKTASGVGYAYLGLNLTEKGIYSLIGINEYKHLQRINLSSNNLFTLQPLQDLHYMTHLNASNNKLKILIDFKAPKCLEVVDLSFNEINSMRDLKDLRFLNELNLNNNYIESIQGIKDNKNLQILKLNNNKIESITGLEDLSLTELHLQGNQITKISGLEFLSSLRYLDICRNQIKKLKGLEHLKQLRFLYLSANKILKVKEIKFIEHLPYLSVLDLCFNPVQRKKFYRGQVLYILTLLRELDGVKCKPEEFVKAENLYNMNVEDRKRIFLEVLPEEEFIDRRIDNSEMIEPESDSENDNIKFVDEYDKTGTKINQQRKQEIKTLTEFQKTRSYTSGFSQKQRATDGFVGY